MNKTTDLEEIKKLAKQFLYMDIVPTDLSPIVVHHPFTNSAFISHKGKDNKIEMANILEDETARKKWQNDVEKMIERTENSKEVFFLIAKNYIFAFLKFAHPYLSKEDLSSILSYAWLNVEQNSMNNILTKAQLVNLFENCDPAILMDAEEFETFKNFPSNLTIYRGVTDYNSKQIEVLSWTLDEKQAEWFATRFNEKGKVYKAKIQKEHVLAYFTGRNEAEVVVDPKFLEEIELYKDFKKINIVKPL